MKYSLPVATVSGINLIIDRWEGFIVAITPFNFTAIGGNLPTAPLCWATSSSGSLQKQVYSAAIIMEVLEAAGLPHGVINMITVDGCYIGSNCIYAS